MAFQQETNVIKIGIEDVSVSLFSPGPNNVEGVQSGAVDVQILLSDSNIETRSYDLIARLQDDPVGQAHLANLASLRDYIRTRLNNEVLP